MSSGVEGNPPLDDAARSAGTGHVMSGRARTVIQADNVYGDIIVHDGNAFARERDVGRSLPAPPNRVVPRPDLSEQVLAALLADQSDEVVALVGVTGAGGFGKTTLAGAMCRDSRIARRFPDGVLWVTLGEETHGAELAGKINQVSARVSGNSPLFTDPEQAGLHLGEVLGDGRYLVVVDDVWRASQLTPFLLGAPDSRRLTTTRVRTALPANAASITVDAMTSAQAAEVLGEGLDIAVADLEPLLARTGSWPVLLTLANRAVRQYVQRGSPAIDAVRQVAERLADGGPTAIDVARADQRRLAVAATVEVSLSLLAETDPAWLERFLELAVFGEDVAIPEGILATYWGHTAEISAAEVRQLCFELAELSLVQSYRAGPEPALGLHDVTRDYLRHRVGHRVREFHRALLDSFRRRAPVDDGTTAWWVLAESDPYVRSHLVHHLGGAGRTDELTAVVTDFRWLHTVVGLDGPAVAEADLAHATGPVAAVLRQAITQNAHLLAPISDVRDGLAITLLSRVHGYPELTAWARDAAEVLPRPRLTAAWPLPDAPHPALRRSFVHKGPVTKMAIGSDGTWLVTASADGTTRLWNTDGTPGTVLSGHDGAVHGVAIDPSENRVITAGADRTARVWNIDRSPPITLIGHSHPVVDVAVSPDGTWLATAGLDYTVRLWDADGRPRHVLVGHEDSVDAVVISPDGTWLASASSDGTVRLWGSDGRSRAILVACAELTIVGQTKRIEALEISPDGSWLVAGCGDGTARIWNADGTLRAELAGHYRSVLAVAISRDGTWLATGGFEGEVRLWDPDGGPRGILSRHERGVTSIAISPDGTWLATGSWDETARVWGIDGSHRATLTGHTGSVLHLAISPDATWFATGSDDGSVRLWNVGVLEEPRTPRSGDPHGVAISPDGTWLAIGDGNTVQLRNADGTLRVTLDDLRTTVSGGSSWNGTWKVAISPDGALLVVGDINNYAQVWSLDVDSGTPVARDCALRDSVICPEGRWFAASSTDGTVRSWDAGISTDTAITRNASSRLRTAVSPDWTWLAVSGSEDGAMRLWNLDGTYRATLAGQHGVVWDVAISPDGSWLAGSCADGTTQLWNIDGSRRGALSCHGGEVWAVSISPDGRLILTAGGDGVIRVWSSTTYHCVCAVRTDSPLREAAWFPSGARVAVVGELGTYVFDIRV